MEPSAPTLTVSLSGPGTTTSTTAAIGPTATAPGLNFIQPAPSAVDDSTNLATFSWPLGFAAIILLVLFTSVLLRARRGRRPPA